MNPTPNRFFHLSLVLLVGLNLIPHFNDYTMQTLGVGTLCLAWRLLYEFQKVALPHFLTKLGLVVSVFYFTFLNIGVLKNIILKLKNNIAIVRAGTM